MRSVWCLLETVITGSNNFSPALLPKTFPWQPDLVENKGSKGRPPPSLDLEGEVSCTLNFT